MDYGNKFLVLTALGVIGVGSAMPYWSSFSSAESENTSANSLNFQSGYGSNPAPPAINQSPTRVDTFIGKSTEYPGNPALGPASETKVLRPSYTPIEDQPRGLDQSRSIPHLPSRFSSEIKQNENRATADFSPQGYSRISLAQNTSQKSIPRKVVPISLNEEEEPYYPVAKVEQSRVGTEKVPKSKSIKKPVSFAPPNEEPQLRRTHLIKDGDTLTALAEDYLNDKELSDAIYTINRVVLSHPELLPIGQQIEIPTTQDIKTWRAQLATRPQTKVQPVQATTSTWREKQQTQTHLVPIRN